MFDKVLSTPTAQVGRVSRFVIFQIKLWTHCARLLRKNRAGQQAAALSYYTVFGLVPLAVVMLMVFQLFPVYKDSGQNIKDAVYEELHLSTIEYPDPTNANATIKLTDNVDAIIGHIFAGFNQGTIAIIGAILIIVAALALLLTIEGAFNNIWGVGRGRSIVHRVINYWALLTLVPLLLATAIYMATKYAAINELQKTLLSHTTPAVISYVVAVVGFFTLYLVLPNARVQIRAAIWGAMVAALVWTFAKWGFKMYVTEFIPYNQLYGVLGLIPLGVFWIYISWLIVLFGLQLTFTTQHLSTLDAAEIAASQKREDYFIANDLTVMSIVREIAADFEAGAGPTEASSIASRMNMPAEFVEKILSYLTAGGILVRVSEPRDGFLPAQAPANIKLSEIAGVISRAGFGQSADMPAGLRKVADLQREALSKYDLKQILGDS